MKTAIVYYSWGGETEKIARQQAMQTQADLFKITETERFGTFKAFTVGCIKALKMQSVPIHSLDAPLAEYEHIIIMGPIWAGHPAPAINAIWDQLPPNKNISVMMVSKSGSSSAKDKINALIERRRCKLSDYQDIKA